MSSYPPRRQVFNHRNRPGGAADSDNSSGGGGEQTGSAAAYINDNTNDNNDNVNDNVSVSSAGTDRASNHNPDRENTSNSNHSNNNNSNNNYQTANTTNLNQRTSMLGQALSAASASPLPVPTTVVAIDAGDVDAILPLPVMETISPMVVEPVKLTAEALAQQNRELANGDVYGIMEVSSNLSRSSSESGYLKKLYKGASVLNNTINNNINENGSNNDIGDLKSSATSGPSSGLTESGAATPAHFQPFGEDVSSLGSLAEDVLLPKGLALDTPLSLSLEKEMEEPLRLSSSNNNNMISKGMGEKNLSEHALSVHPTLSVETPPKDNLTSSCARIVSDIIPSQLVGGEAVAFPIELATLKPRLETPPPRITNFDNRDLSFSDRLLPMGTGSAPAPRVRVDSTIASTRPPSAPPLSKSHHANSNNNNNNNSINNNTNQHHLSPFPSPKPPKAIRVGSGASSNQSPNVVHRQGNSNGNNKKATFQDYGPALTRTSSNASSNTNTTNASLTTRTIRLGICAMDKKARSKPMSEILKRLDSTTFEAVYFGDDLILNEPVENWPICEVLIAFYSNGYPLEKAEQYVALRQPYLLNDLKMQRILMDRRRVYDLLEESGIDVPRHVFMSRDGYVSKGTGDGSVAEGSSGNGSCTGCVVDEPEIEEHDDHIEVNGVTINKPFVEKPVDADDHNIAIYYPSSAGGGCKKLFRKVGDRSSEFYPEINDIRRDGSYIYEEFIETQGTDVKMYTVGPDYGHAEARKSPAVDGKVERNPDGKEVRFPVILTLREKEIARRIVLVFKQQVCGFDILRIQEGDSLVSYVCDVNGWSFVKNSRKYYDDCAQILTEHMRAALLPKSQVSFSALEPLLASVEDPMDDIGTPGYGGSKHNRKKKKKKQNSHQRGGSIVDRAWNRLIGESNAEDHHEDGDKDEENDKLSDLQQQQQQQKVYFDGSNVGLPVVVGEAYDQPVDFTNNFTNDPVRNIPDQLATEPASSASIVPSGSSSLADLDDMSLGKESNGMVATTTHQEELRCVITIVRHGDRTPKQKLKDNIKGEHFLRYFHDHSKKAKKDLKIKAKKNMVEFLETVKAVISDLEAEGAPQKNRDKLYKARHIKDILQRWKFSGLNRKLQMKPRKWIEEETPDGGTKTKCSELQLIVKWGGDLTKLGERQAVRLGNRLRNELYPSNKGGGILRLHSTFRHDLKIKTSDEGRVMKTAAAFAKGMLELEGEIPPILVSLVHKEKDSRHMLDPSGNNDVKADLDNCKEMININMQKDLDYDKMTKEERERLVGPERLVSLHRALKEIGNPRKTLNAIHSTIGQLVEQLDEMLGELLSGDEEVIEGGEGLKGKEEHDEALSGIKLYKGETLLELTERWKLLQNKLYDEEKDTFDLSRVPDVHDNVRFDMLHNQHLGLTKTLQKLYDLAKSMADCVVPQEYGITIEEKRDIGSKMCHTLLEKINYDLAIARTDNQVDMRYMINMDYSADLPINSMGRRVRSRLYFTSESHLHSMLNVLRFPSIVPSPLSLNGQEILANASELCYLTQVVFRLFEDTQKPSEDPQRFRVEISFSPGATATPLHMAELYREKDATRFDTEKLQKISIDNLTCAQVEEYFAEAIKEGKIDEDDDDEDEKMSKPVSEKKKDKKKKKGEEQAEISSTVKHSNIIEHDQTNNGTSDMDNEMDTVEDVSDKGIQQENNVSDKAQASNDDVITDSSSGDSDRNLSIEKDHYWQSAMVFGVLLGAGCLFMMSKRRQ